MVEAWLFSTQSCSRLGPRRVARQPAGLAQGGEAVAAAGEDLVDVGLVAGVPQEDVVGRVEHPVEGEGELDHAQVGAQVAAGDRHRLDDELADLAGQLLELLGLEPAQVGRSWRSSREAISDARTLPPAGAVDVVGAATVHGAGAATWPPMDLDRFQYLILMGLCLLITLPLEFLLGARVWRQPRRLLAALRHPRRASSWSGTSIAIAREHWAYNPALRHRLGAAGDLPVEELAFFVVIPICGLLTYEAVRRVLPSATT